MLGGRASAEGDGRFMLDEEQGISGASGSACLVELVLERVHWLVGSATEPH
jgi:hypothetical protein